MREPKRTSAGCEAILPAASASPWPKVVARSTRPGGTKENTLGHVGEVGHRVHSHQDQVVALREHVLVDLLWSLGDHDQVEPELATFTRDPDGVLGGQGGERIGRLCRAHVLRLIDDDGHRLASPLVRAIGAPERRPR